DSNDYVAMDTPHAISVHGFKTIISYFFRFSKSSAIDQALATRIFQTFAASSNAMVTFDEFICGMSTLIQGAKDPRGRMIHSILDLDRGGTITKNEIEMILRSRARVLQNQDIKDLNLERNATEIMKVLDANGDGDISVDEFMAAIQKSPHVLDALQDILFSGCHLDDDFDSDEWKQQTVRNAIERTHSWHRDLDKVQHPDELIKDFKKIFVNAVKKVSAATAIRRNKVPLLPSPPKVIFKPIGPQ
ncbi:hypothetical protein As57867_007180, partial [Aphanomyces stellatus]